MADENVPAPAPTRFDDQMFPFTAWVPIGKSNFVLDLQKKQTNPIFQISMDILPNTNFFRAFTASASDPAIYIQQFWNTLTYEAKTKAYKITPIDQAHQFVSPPSGDAIMDFINELGCTEEIHFVSRMAEEFVQAMQTFIMDKANLGSPTKKGRKDKPHVIPYCQFTKLIICHLGRKHNLHQRFGSLLHLAKEDLRLGNLKFVPKGEDDEVFGMPIPNELITNKIRNAPYYNTYMEMIAKHDLKIAAEKGGKKKPATAKQLKPKPVKEKSSKPTPLPKPKSSLQPIDEDEPSQPKPEPEPVHQCEGEEYDVERAEATRPLLVVEGKGKAIATEEQAAQSPLALHTPKMRIRDSLSPADAETGADIDKTNSGGDTEILQIGEEQGEDVDNQVNLEEKIAELDQGQAGSDPDPGESCVALAGPNPKPTHDEFMANVYPNVHESLKFPADEHVILEDPLSSSRTLSSMKNLDDAYTIGDQFLNDKSTEDEPRKLNVEAEVVFMVTVPIY
ncbi:hypothetical protein Tco_0768772, partial [Tanacetum coccineum]